MATIHDLPTEYQATAERIPADLLKRLSGAEAVARVLQHDALTKTASCFSDGASARAFFDAAAAMLRDDHVDLPPQLLAKGTALVAARMGAAAATGPVRLRRLPSGQVVSGAGHWVKSAEYGEILVKALPANHNPGQWPTTS